MIKMPWFICALLFSTTIHATPAQTYLNKFMTYTHWCQHLPTYPDPNFLAFIDKPSPLTRKLREKWLYQLAYNKDWAAFSRFYRGSDDSTLQCYAQTAAYNQGHHEEALARAKKLWLSGGSLPKSCDTLFATMLKNNELNNTLIQKRIALALEANNLSLARYLLKQYKPARIQDAELLTGIYQHPARVGLLKPGPFQGEFYLYGLKRMVQNDMDGAVDLMTVAHTHHIMSDTQEQKFLAHLSLYKAMRNQPDTPQWFAKVKPAFYNETLLEWEMRFALTHHQWRKVVYLISKSNSRREPNNQYWMARALEALGEKETANVLYKQLAAKRNYYGFLASLKLKQKPSFENEYTPNNPGTLLPYKPITDQIKALYLSHQTVDASRLLNDFVSELPKHEKSALAYWVANHLHWHGKSIYLSSNDALNNQLSLRFPLPYQDSVREYAKNYQIRPAFIYAVIRQESSFQEGISSPAGANGLMQLMPATARHIAKQAKIPYASQKQLFTSQKNIHIGTAYLQTLSKQFRQHPILMAAAYNAGPRQVNYWLKNHTPTEMDIWIETLPWRETRNYLKNILAFYTVYQYRMNEKPSLDAFMRPF